MHIAGMDVPCMDKDYPEADACLYCVRSLYKEPVVVAITNYSSYSGK